MRRAGAGIFAGALTLALSYPFDVVQTLQMADNTHKLKNRQFKGFFPTVNYLYLEGGRNSLYRGVSIPFVAMAP